MIYFLTFLIFLVISAESLRKVILDFDPGVDDAIAFLWLASKVKQKQIDLLAVTSIAGNVPSRQCCENALRLVATAGIQTQVACSIVENTDDELEGDKFHGKDGLANSGHLLADSEVHFNSVPDAVTLLSTLIDRHPGELTILVAGPVTNLAALLDLRPNLFKDKLFREIIVMGGALERHGNVQPHAEFNFWFDGAATKKVYDAIADTPSSLVLFPLDVTETLCFDTVPEIIKELTDYPSPLQGNGKKVFDFLDKAVGSKWSKRQTAAFGQKCYHVHDAFLVGYLLKPWLFTFRRRELTANENGELRRVKAPHHVESSPNTWIAETVDDELFLLHIRADLMALLENLSKEYIESMSKHDL